MATGGIWVNRAEEIIRSEVGSEEFNRRLENQKLLFKVGYYYYYYGDNFHSDFVFQLFILIMVEDQN